MGEEGLRLTIYRQDLYLDPSIRVRPPSSIEAVADYIGLGPDSNHDDHGMHANNRDRESEADEQVLVGLLRHYVTVLMNSAPKKQPSAAVREQSVHLHP